MNVTTGAYKSLVILTKDSDVNISHVDELKFNIDGSLATVEEEVKTVNIAVTLDSGIIERIINVPVYYKVQENGPKLSDYVTSVQSLSGTSGVDELSTVYTGDGLDLEMKLYHDPAFTINSVNVAVDGVDVGEVTSQITPCDGGSNIDIKFANEDNFIEMAEYPTTITFNGTNSEGTLLTFEKEVTLVGFNPNDILDVVDDNGNVVQKYQDIAIEYGTTPTLKINKLFGNKFQQFADKVVIEDLVFSLPSSESIMILDTTNATHSDTNEGIIATIPLETKELGEYNIEHTVNIAVKYKIENVTLHSLLQIHPTFKGNYDELIMNDIKLRDLVTINTLAVTTGSAMIPNNGNDCDDYAILPTWDDVDRSDVDEMGNPNYRRYINLQPSGDEFFDTAEFYVELTDLGKRLLERKLFSISPRFDFDDTDDGYYDAFDIREFEESYSTLKTEISAKDPTSISGIDDLSRGYDCVVTLMIDYKYGTNFAKTGETSIPPIGLRWFPNNWGGAN